MKQALLLSLILHLLFLGALLYVRESEGAGSGPSTEAGNQEGEEQAKDPSGDIAPKGSDAEENKPVEVSLVYMPEKQSKSTEGLKECIGDKWYGGVGVILQYNTITEVADGYPAKEAGVKVGDILTRAANGDISNLRGDPGTMVSFTVRRNGGEIDFSIIRDRICLE